MIMPVTSGQDLVVRNELAVSMLYKLTMLSLAVNKPISSNYYPIVQ